MGTEISWLLPAALIGLVAGVWFTARTPRTGPVRAQLLLWGGWLLVTGAVFSFMTGVIHPYYTVALAPAIAALIGISVRELWRGREFRSSRAVLATMSAATGVWAFILLDRTPDWLPALAVGAAHRIDRRRCGDSRRRAPAGPGHRRRRGRPAVRPRCVRSLFSGHRRPLTPWAHSDRRAHQRTAFGPGPRNEPGDNADVAAIARERQTPLGRSDCRLDVGGSHFELQTGTSIMAIGGFTGSDNSPTLQQFQQYVAEHQVHYFIAGQDRGSAGSGRHRKPDHRLGEGQLPADRTSQAPRSTT